MQWIDEIDPLAAKVAFWLVALSDPSYPIDEMGTLSLEQARNLRALAVLQLLGLGSTDLFLHNLMRAGRARWRYLERAQADPTADKHYTGAAWMTGLLDAVAAGDVVCARGIAAGVHPAILPGEYEDDHYFARAVGALVQSPPDVAAANRSLDEFAAYLAGEPDARLAVLRALVDQKQAAFDQAFDDLLHRFDDAVSADRARHQLEDPVVLALREVDVDSLAILRLAEQLGLSTALEYPRCPSLARLPMRAPFREI